MTHPEVRVAVDHHGALDQFVGTLQEVVARDHAGVVDQYVHVPHLAAHLLGGGIHTLALPHVAHVGVDLRLERRHLLHAADRSLQKREKERGREGEKKRRGVQKVSIVRTWALQMALKGFK